MASFDGIARGRDEVAEEFPLTESPRIASRRKSRDVPAVLEASPLLLDLYRSADLLVASLGLLAVMAVLQVVRAPAAGADLLNIRFSLYELLHFIGFMAVWYGAFAAVELYDARQPRHWRDELQRVVAGTLPGTAVLLAFLAFQPQPRADDHSLLAAAMLFWATVVSGTIGARSALRRVLHGRARPFEKRIIIVGSGARAQRVFQRLSATARHHEVLGFVDSDGSRASAEVKRRTLGGLDDLEQLLMRNDVDEVVIALPVKSQYARIQQAIHTCERMGVDARYLADVFEWNGTRVELDGRSALESVVLKAVPRDYRSHIKRTVDLTVSIMALLFLSPIMLLIGLAIRLQDGGPIFFVQQRHGLHKHAFPMYKFRTMVPGADRLQDVLEARNEITGAIFKIRHDPRVTRVGALLRRTSLDELPQLFNVVVGHMSLVGPRPLPPRDVAHFEQSWRMRRFSVRPGITGLWQVSGRSELSFDDLVALDLKYIDEWSLWLDARILARTVAAVISGRGAV
jgi:exopolysaccharide biosynthesis polyprenyl glycosylphosphotransferase